MFNSSKGAGFTGTNAPILSPISGEQTLDAYNQAQQSLQQQRSLVDQLRAQQGIQNQNDVYSQQQGLAQQLGLQAQGGGPNPALAQLAQSTGANTANQAALMAGQRGSNQNVGLLARQAAQQGAANQQNAAGQGATLRAQQQLAAQQALQQQQGMMGNLATQQAGQYIGGIGNLNQGIQNEQNMLLNSAAQQNNAAIGMQSNVNNVNAGIAQGNQGFQQGVLNKVAGGIGSALSLAEGGQVPHIDPAKAQAAQDSMRKAFHYADGGPVSSFGQMLQGQGNQLANQAVDIGGPMGMSNFQSGLQKGNEFGGAGASKGKSIFAGQIGSAGSSDLMSAGPEMVAAYGGMASKGGHVPGKAEVKGDSLRNDKVDAKLSPGEIVIPRSIAQGKDAPKKAAEFVAAILAKKNMGKK